MYVAVVGLPPGRFPVLRSGATAGGGASSAVDLARISMLEEKVAKLQEDNSMLLREKSEVLTQIVRVKNEAEATDRTSVKKDDENTALKRRVKEVEEEKEMASMRMMELQHLIDTLTSNSDGYRKKLVLAEDKVKEVSTLNETLVAKMLALKSKQIDEMNEVSYFYSISSLSPLSHSVSISIFQIVSPSFGVTSVV
jgi:chromosome segregation ATPase